MTTVAAPIPAVVHVVAKNRAARWGSWVVGAAALAAVIVVARHFTEERAFVDILQHAKPWWVLVAVALQALTYVAQGEVWRIAARAGGATLPRGEAYKLSLAKLFVDQALPSGGVSGTLVFARALERRGIARATVMACVFTDGATYYICYAACLLCALALAVGQGYATTGVVAVSAVFIVLAVAISSAMIAFAGRRVPPALRQLVERLKHLRVIVRALDLVEVVDARVVRDPATLAGGTAYHVVIVALDTATMWFLLLSLGFAAAPAAVFISFMTSTLFRTVGIVPGGLGTFEAASVLTLKLAGVPVGVALSATLAFRMLSFWLPMVPGLLMSRTIEHAPLVRPKLAPQNWWSLSAADIFAALGTTQRGLSATEAARRLRIVGPNDVTEHDEPSRLRTLWNQFRNPLVLLLVFACVASALSGEWVDAVIVLLIVMASTGVSYSREYRAQSAASALLSRIEPRATVVRDGRERTIFTREVVPGDVMVLSAGSVVSADGVILESNDFFVNEAVLTGESFPVEKTAGPSAVSAPVAQRNGCVLFGTNVRSGSARVVALETGSSTVFGGVAHRLRLRPPETEFDRGVRRFGALLTRAMLVMIVVVFAANMFLHRTVAETLLFAIALAVGLSPELLPAILSVNLARAAQVMAKRGVLVRHLSGIENLGSMDILCTDKTGTLTEGVIRLEGAYDDEGRRSERVLELALTNASLQSGVKNPLDLAILQAGAPKVDGVEKLAEIPYDFVRKRLSVVVRTATGAMLVTKGAVEPLLERCVRSADGKTLDAGARAALTERFQQWAAQGTRVLAVATRAMPDQAAYARDDECELELAGFLTFLDTPKQGVAETLRDLRALGVSVKLITGDAGLVARHVAERVGLKADVVLSGRDLDELHDEALWHAAERTDLFVEVDPNQKERIILALKKQSHVVGFLGDGVNDAPAMHAADTSISVDDAVDVARQAADFVLLERDLDVIRRGIEEGRKTFANTLKYLLTTTSANLGNMISMAAASFFLPFLPLTAGQILLNNFLSDIPAVGIAGDNVDAELINTPRRWDMRFIGRFMVQFGLLSSLFDVMTFAFLSFVFRASAEQFRTSWFVESLLTELLIALVVRTRRPFFRSRPGKFLWISSVVLVIVSFALPYLPFTAFVGFVPLPASVALAIGAIAAAYVLAVELLKSRFYRHIA